MVFFTTVVADIRPATREALVRRLREHGRFAIAGVFSTWTDGLEAVRRRSPHVAFLPMPETADAARLRELASADGPSVVLIGADPDQATRAFDLGAVDYLVRPPAAARIDRTLGHLCDERRAPGEAMGSARWWPFRHPDGEFLLPLTDVRRLEATRDGATVHTSVRPHRTSTPFETLAGALTRRGFVRVNAGELVRGDVVRELRQVTHDTWDLVLEGGALVRSASSERTAVESLMETLGELASH